MTFVFQKFVVFLINSACASLPVLFLSPIPLYYFFSNNPASGFVGSVVLINTLLLIPLFYFVLSMVFANAQSPGEKAMALELKPKGFLIVLKRVGVSVVGFYVLFFLQLSGLIAAYVVFYFIFVLFQKNNKSLLDVLFKTEYFSSQKTKTPYNNRKGKDLLPKN